MHGTGTRTLLVAGAVFAIFVANVVIGAMGASVFLSDVAEMLILFLASVLFVVAVLRRERSETPVDTLSEDMSNEGGNQA